MTLAQASNAEPVSVAARIPGMVVKWLAGVAALVVMALGIGQASGSAAATGQSSLSARKPGVACVKDQLGPRECGIGITIENSELAISPDGKNGYLLIPLLDVEGERGAVRVYDRDPSSGSLVQKQGTPGCIAQGRMKGCVPGRALRFGFEIAISPDGRNVYASTEDSIAIRAPAT
jgi:hypothetical protein